MKTNKDIKPEIDSIFEVIDAIEPVNVSPFFKDKTMQRLFSEKEEKQIVWSWFTPKMQLVTLVGVVILNIIAFTRLQESSYSDNVKQFAESYGLSTSTETSLLN